MTSQASSKKSRGHKKKPSPSSTTPSDVANPTITVPTPKTKTDDASIASSVISQVDSQKLRQQFPSTKQPTDFNNQPKFLDFLINNITLSNTAITRLMELGWTTPSEVVNAFGGKIRL